MAEIEFEGHRFGLAPGESVLDALLRGGADLPFSCRKGICQSCVARCLGTAVPATAQGELKPTLRAENAFLACLWRPQDDQRIERLDAARLFSPATVVEVEALSSEIRRVLLEPATPLYYHPGQFLNLRAPSGLVRSYSLASVPARDPLLELHVRRLANGRVSGWIHEALSPGTTLAIEGPHGRCFYLPGREEQPLLLIGTGSGLAPLIGIARDALGSGHRGPIHLYHGAADARGLYLGRELQELARTTPAFHYRPCLTRESADGVHHGRAEDLAAAEHPRLTGWRVYLCGHPGMVATARKRAYLAGAALADIHADPFELTDLRRETRP